MAGGGYRRNAGRKSTPTMLKLIQGNPGKRPINKDETETSDPALRASQPDGSSRYTTPPRRLKNLHIARGRTTLPWLAGAIGVALRAATRRR